MSDCEGTQAKTDVSVSSSSEKISEDDSEYRYLPSNLASEELQLALNKEANKEQLESAITRCKELVLESEQFSIERKWLVRHLIELRLRLQEFKEAQLDPQHPYNKCGNGSNLAIRGHHLVLQPLLQLSSSQYCDHCTGTIWNVIQVWYKCEDCGYACHHKCLSGIMRECAYMVITEKGAYEHEICPEDGLSAQKYKCHECKTPLSLTEKWYEPRCCDYSGKYYCSACHWGCEAVIPARVIHNWDMIPRPVCQATLQLLKITSKNALINLENLNPRLFTLVHELNLVRRLRYELHGMRRYLLVCRFANKDRFLWKNVDVPHLVESPDLYSLQDLMDTYSGDLPTKLHALTETFLKHIKIDCELCKGRGYLCEICTNDEILFPFDKFAYCCSECGALLHKNCFKRKSEECPKCKRRQTRKQNNEESITSD